LGVGLCKTTLTLHAIASCQKAGGTAAFIDAEHALDTAYAQALGINLDDLVIAQPDTGEQGLEICEQLAASGAVDLVVVDSVAALVPRAEVEGTMEDTQVGLPTLKVLGGLDRAAARAPPVGDAQAA
jgi:recombination protein RecA